MSLFDVLNLARGGMTAAQIGIAVTSNNVANAATEGYSRQSLALGTAGSARWHGLLVGRGVRPADVLRAFDAFTEARLQRERSHLAFADTLATAYSSMEGLFQDGLETGLAPVLQGFFDSFASLSAAPDDPSWRTEALSAAERLAASFSDTAAALGEQRDVADGQVAAEAAAVTDLATRIADLNARIVSAEAGGATAGDLRDERNRLVTELSGIVEVRTWEDKDGSLSVSIEGEELVSGTIARGLIAERDPATGLRRLYVQGSDAVRTDLTARVRGGSIGAALDVRDAVVPDLLAELDQLAWDLVQQVNAVFAAGYGLDGASGRMLFEAPAEVSGAALSMRLSADVEGDPDALAAAADPAGLPGDGTVAAALADLAGQAFVDGGSTPVDALAALIGGLGARSASAQADYAQQQFVVDDLQALRDSRSGVSMEEESLDLIRYQDAYEASARVLSAVQEMLDVLLEI